MNESQQWQTSLNECSTHDLSLSAVLGLVVLVARLVGDLLSRALDDLLGLGRRDGERLLASEAADGLLGQRLGLAAYTDEGAQVELGRNDILGIAARVNVASEQRVASAEGG